ncbi:sulfotransferase 4A1 [Fopius arisanus]|uniref:SULT4A1_0 protein n=1 Tax=Fopius arisanus TaxID=64838 RepID=A0A0C9RBE9_9HYME|nr:PREDICTED: sulfotransferase 4A1-like [Fopius arisanus]
MSVNPELSNLEKLREVMLACVKENGYVMEPLWKKEGELYRNFQAKPDDVWIMTLPRSGTTVTQEIVYLLMNNFNFETARKFPFFVKVVSINTSLCPHLWTNSYVLLPGKDNPGECEVRKVDASKSSAEVYADLPSPRLFKSHLTFSVINSILESGAKTIYVARNPKDRLVSWWKLLPSMARIPCDVDFATFWRCVRNEQILYEPTWKHIKEGWAQRHNPNVLFLFYEDIRQDLPGAIRKIANFLGKPCSEQQIEDTVRYLDIDSFRQHVFGEDTRPDAEQLRNMFVGKGQIGGYKDVISPKIEKEMDDWIEENLRGTDIAFPGLNC